MVNFHTLLNSNPPLLQPRKKGLRVRQIQDLGQSKYKLTLLKNDSRDFKNYFYLIPTKPGKQNQKVPFFGYS